MLGQKLVADVMEIADQGRGDAALAKCVADMRHCGCGLVTVDRDPHQFGARARKRWDLRQGARDIGGVGVGHRLHHNRRAPADGDIADHDLRGFMPGLGSGDVVLWWFDRLVHGVSNIRFWWLPSTYNELWGRLQPFNNGSKVPQNSKISNFGPHPS